MPGRGGKRRRGGGSKTRSLGRGGDERLRTAKGRRLSSARWLSRQLRDPYVTAARRRGYRSRAAFKLIELDDKFRFLKPGARVVDLGAAPGGWTQVAAARVEAGRAGGGRVVAVDRETLEPVPGVIHLTMDVLEAAAPAAIRAALDGPAHVVLSELAGAATGHGRTDHLRVMGLLEAAYEFAKGTLAPGGAFVGKVLRGGTEKALLDTLKRDFRDVRHVKPPASRKESAEIYVVATGFRGSSGSGRPGRAAHRRSE